MKLKQLSKNKNVQIVIILFIYYLLDSLRAVLIGSVNADITIVQLVFTALLILIFLVLSHFKNNPLIYTNTILWYLVLTPSIPIIKYLSTGTCEYQYQPDFFI